MVVTNLTTLPCPLPGKSLDLGTLPSSCDDAQGPDTLGVGLQHACLYCLLSFTRPHFEFSKHASAWASI